MADPLSQLRQFHINGREIKEQNGYIIFGEHGWPKDVNTNYLVYSTEDDRSKREYYTLECLWYFLQNMDVSHTHYVKQAGRDDKRAVMRPDRKPLLAYLKGESQTAPGIDKNAPIPALRVPVSEIIKKDSLSGSAGDRHASGSFQGPSGQSNDTSRIEGQSSTAKKRLPQDDQNMAKLKEEFAARLNEPSTKKLATVGQSVLKSSETNEGSAAISMLGLDKLAAMKAKRMAKKRTEIADAETEPVTGLAEAGNREDPLYAADAEKFKLIKSKEKVWRTRSSVLQSQKKEFKNVLETVLPLLTKLDDPNRKPTNGMQIPSHDSVMMNAFPQQNNSHQQQQQQQQQSIQKSYNRYDQERFVKLDIGVEIDTKKSFVGGVSTQPTTRPSAMGVVPNNGTVMVPRPHGDVVDHRRTLSSRGLKKPRSLMPIIIIPATTTSIINMYNAKTILEELSYVEGKAGSKGRENDILIQRKKIDGTSAHYKVLDNPQKLEMDDWHRVVAVFVQGPSWQFKGWPWGGSPVEIFSNMKGFHLKWDEAKLDDNVAKWNVQVLELSRNKRHLDKANLMRFWASLDSFISKYRSYLKY